MPANAEDIDEYYYLISPSQPTQTGSKVEVLEIFYYGCIHCYNYEPHLLSWLENKPAAAEFRRMPAIFNRNMRPLAKAFYTAEQLGVLEQIHQPLFDAIHRENRNISDDESLKAFFVSRGIDADEFSRVYNSREVAEKVRFAEVMGREYRIPGVPAVIVNGKYLTGPSPARGFKRLERVLEKLIARESS